MWTEWSPRAFARAEAEKKPVLLSLVTAWSDECAAMDQTTFVAPDVVSLIDERFVAVRVDADRRPDVNERYNLGGWPTTAFLTSRWRPVERRNLSRRRADDRDACSRSPTPTAIAPKRLHCGEFAFRQSVEHRAARADRCRSARQRRAIPLAPHRALRLAERRLRDLSEASASPRAARSRSRSPATATASSQASLR